jgi:hypothetical protein
VPVMDGLVPVTVTVYIPPLPVQLRVLVPEPPVIVVVLRVHVSPVLGETEVASVTVPVNPLTGITKIMLVAATPGLVVTGVGLADIVKSTTWTLMLAVE